MINKKYISIALALSFISFSSFAATGSDLVDPLSSDTGISVNSGELNNEPAMMTNENLTSTSSSLAPKGGISNYTEVPCDTDYFTSNSCNQCFEGGKKASGEKITSLNDSWTNPNSGEQVIYKDEQIMPELINLGGEGTNWISNPVDSSKFWKFSDEIVWTDSKTGSGKQEYLLEGGKTVNFLEGDLGATYVLDSTDKQDGIAVGLLKFNIAYHDIDGTGKESISNAHTECVRYLAGPQVTKTPVPQTKEVTKVKTGPELYILLALAFAMALIFMRLKKRI